MDLKNSSVPNLSNQVNLRTSNDPSSNIWSEINESFLQELEEPFDPDHENTSKLRIDAQYKGFDNNAGGQYIYPINLPIRTYQYNIIKASLFQNTLIVLPTGLGKTFIAAVIMYNIYRWYPTGKVIFMAPTRPLVSQQIEACCKIMGIPIDDTAEMTGKQNKNKRTELWDNKRIFFATPQVVQIDINDRDVNFPFHKIKLIVIDEAHKAKGRYAYTDVVQTINNRNPYFRIIALSATPGRRIEDVMEIIQNLCISHIEVRSENSVDVLPFTFRKNIKTVLVPLGEKLTRIRDDLINIIDPYVRNLIDNGVLNGNTGNFTKFWLVMEQKRFREMFVNQRHPKHSVVSTDFSICISLYHALELLERHGLRVFLNFFDDPDPGKQNEKFFVQSNSTLRKFLNDLRQEIGPNPFTISDQTMTNGKIQNIADNLDFGHPKFEMVKKFLVDHFQECVNSKVIVFCEFRESVMLLHRLLLQIRPLILPRVFVGQGGTGSIRAVSQKEQIQVMNDFRNGIINTLIATSVAEEGIDVGEVNLIICFDISSKNPTRFVQRIGRTGRKQHGQVIILATEGKEYSLVKEVLATRDKVNQKLSNSRAVNHTLYQRSPRIVPPEFNPKCLEVFMRPQYKESIQENVKSTKKAKQTKIPETNNKKPGKRKKETAPNSQDVRNFFKKIELDDDKEIFCSPEKKTNKPDDIINVDYLIKEFSPITQFEKPNTLSEQRLSISNVTIDDLELNFRKLNHLARNLDKMQNLSEYSNVVETIQSKNIDKNVKKFILLNNIKFVREKFEAMLLRKLNSSETENLREIDDSENELKLIYSSIEEVLGDKYAIEKFLHENTGEKLEKISITKNLNVKFSSFFEEFEERDLTDNVEGFILQKLNEIDLNSLEAEVEKIEVVTKSENASTIYENVYESEPDASITNYEFDLDFQNESKYADQWTQFDNQKNNQSTPINRKTIEETNRNTSGTKQNSDKNISSITKNNDILKTDCHSTEKTKLYTLNISSKLHSNNLYNNISSKLHSNNLYKNDEISVDLFDDDFDEILSCNDNLKLIENKTKPAPPAIINSTKKEINRANVISDTKNYNSFKPNYSHIAEKHEIYESLKESSIKNVQSTTETVVSDKDYNFMKPKYRFLEESDLSMSMIEINKVLEIVTERDETEKTKHNIINPDLDDFDLNDFLEPFEVEIDSKEYKSKGNIKHTMNDKTTTQPSDAIFDRSPSNEMQQPKDTLRIHISSKEFADGSNVISPSLIGRRKPGYSQLRLIRSKINTTPSSKIKNLNTEKHINKSEAAKSLFNILELDHKNSVNEKIENKIDEVSIIFRSCRNLRNIIESSESDVENAPENKLSQEIQITPIKTRALQRWNERKTNRMKRCKKYNFIDDEVVHSGNGSSEDEACNETNILDSVVVIDGEEEEDDPNVDMHAKYLQSIRSPKHLPRGTFKIPPQRKFMDLSRIFSQRVKPDDTLNDCSFVVSDEDNVFDGEVTEICPLEEAEAILKARRKTKRRQKQDDVKVNKRRRIINDFVEMSDNE